MEGARLLVDDAEPDRLREGDGHPAASVNDGAHGVRLADDGRLRRLALVLHLDLAALDRLGHQHFARSLLVDAPSVVEHPALHRLMLRQLAAALRVNDGRDRVRPVRLPDRLHRDDPDRRLLLLRAARRRELDLDEALRHGHRDGDGLLRVLVHVDAVVRVDDALQDRLLQRDLRVGRLVDHRADEKRLALLHLGRRQLFRLRRLALGREAERALLRLDAGAVQAALVADERLDHPLLHHAFARRPALRLHGEARRRHAAAVGGRRRGELPIGLQPEHRLHRPLGVSLVDTLAERRLLHRVLAQLEDRLLRLAHRQRRLPEPAEAQPTVGL